MGNPYAQSSQAENENVNFEKKINSNFAITVGKSCLRLGWIWLPKATPKNSENKSKVFIAMNYQTLSNLRQCQN